MRAGPRGFTLIELLIALVVVGILAAIAIPALLNAVQRAKQKRTMGDMRAVGLALQVHAGDDGDFPLQPVAGPLSAVADQLAPTYMPAVPTRDAWGGDILHQSDARAYALTSYGKDRAAGGGGAVSPDGGTTDFANDIVFADGSFLQFPEGVQN